MKKQFLSLTLMTLLLSLILFSCYGPSENNPIDTGKGILSGKVFDANGDGVSGVLVECGGKTAFTNPLGEFKLTDIAGGNRKLVNFTKDSYVSTQKIVKIADMKLTYTEAALYRIGKTQTINTSAKSTVSYAGAIVELPANGLVDTKGNLYSGNADVKFTYFNPTDARFNDAFPGDFAGVQSNGKEAPIESYGFIDVEINNGNEKLQLAEGSPATVTMPIPAKLSANAPSSIPLWFYDTQKGKWIEYGVANKVGNSYVGEVTHFSKINCDMPYSELSSVTGRVVDQDGNPLAGAWVKLTGVDFTGDGHGWGSTGDDGKFEFIRVKANALVQIVAYYAGFYSAQVQLTTAANGGTVDAGDIEVFIDPNLVSGWTEIGDLSGKYASDVQFINETTGWLLAQGVYHTDDGGVTWTLQKDMGGGQDSTEMRTLCMIDENNGWAVGAKVYYTNDGGLNWNEKDVDPGKKLNFMDAFFVNVNYGWLIGTESYKTQDGGNTWQKMTIDTGQSNHYAGRVFFADVNTGYISTYYGKLFKTTDGGDSWTALTVPNVKYGYASMFFVDANTGWLAFSGENTKLFFTLDGGANFVEQSHTAMGQLQDIFFRNSSEGWIVGTAGTIIHTVDGGVTWTNQFTKSVGNYRRVCFVTDDIGWIVGSGTNGSVLLYTDTGGDPK
ncbi:MAG: YCF48-related protein [bacterium]